MERKEGIAENKDRNAKNEIRMRESEWEFGNLDGNAGNARNQGRSQGISRNQWENVGNRGGDAGNQGGKLGTAVEMK